MNCAAHWLQSQSSTNVVAFFPSILYLLITFGGIIIRRGYLSPDCHTGVWGERDGTEVERLQWWLGYCCDPRIKIIIITFSDNAQGRYDHHLNWLEWQKKIEYWIWAKLEKYPAENVISLFCLTLWCLFFSLLISKKKSKGQYNGISSFGLGNEMKRSHCHVASTPFKQRGHVSGQSQIKQIWHAHAIHSKSHQNGKRNRRTSWAESGEFVNTIYCCYLLIQLLLLSILAIGLCSSLQLRAII